jgi:hypothetical protein
LRDRTDCLNLRVMGSAVDVVEVQFPRPRHGRKDIPVPWSVPKVDCQAEISSFCAHFAERFRHQRATLNWEPDAIDSLVLG